MRAPAGARGCALSSGGGAGTRRHRAELTDAQLDAVVFPELGMDPAVMLLAFARFAPVQIASHGNSVRSGGRGHFDIEGMARARTDTRGLHCR